VHRQTDIDLMISSHTKSKNNSFTRSSRHGRIHIGCWQHPRIPLQYLVCRSTCCRKETVRRHLPHPYSSWNL